MLFRFSICLFLMLALCCACVSSATETKTVAGPPFGGHAIKAGDSEAGGEEEEIYPEMEVEPGFNPYGPWDDEDESQTSVMRTESTMNACKTIQDMVENINEQVQTSQLNATALKKETHEKTEALKKLEEAKKAVENARTKSQEAYTKAQETVAIIKKAAETEHGKGKLDNDTTCQEAIMSMMNKMNDAFDTMYDASDAADTAAEAIKKAKEAEHRPAITDISTVDVTPGQGNGEKGESVTSSVQDSKATSETSSTNPANTTAASSSTNSGDTASSSSSKEGVKAGASGPSEEKTPVGSTQQKLTTSLPNNQTTVEPTSSTHQITSRGNAVSLPVTLDYSITPACVRASSVLLLLLMQLIA